MRRLAPALAALMLAGCAGGFGEECAPPQASARWQQPELFEAVARAVAADPELRVPMEEDRLPPLRSPVVGEWPEPRLSMLEWRDEGGWVRLHPWRPGELEVMTPYHDDEVVLARLEAALDALGLAESRERQAWERALLASRGQGAYLRAMLVGTPDVEGLLATLGPGEVAPEPGIGVVTIEWPAWRVVVRILTHSLQAPHEDGVVRLVVDARGHAIAWADVPAEEPARELLHARVADAFAPLGLPEPTFAEATSGGSGCRRG